MQPISCQLHDYIEIACLYHLQISLTLADGFILKGTALTTETTADRQELLIIKVGTEPQKINLSDIQSMRALQENPHFDTVKF